MTNLKSICRPLLLVKLFLVLVVMHMTPCGADPSTCPDYPMIGYSDFAMLQQDINEVKTFVPNSYHAASEPFVFKICPNTTFTFSTNGNGNQGLYFHHSNTLPVMILQCGEDGRSSDNCILKGGLHHVWVDAVGSLIFQGLTFERAQRGSVWMGTGQTQMTFEDCIWRYNTHAWTEATSTVCPNGCAAALGGQYGSATVSNSQFINNTASSGAVYGESMIFTFEKCLFRGNRATGRLNEEQPAASAITMVGSTSFLSLSHCCFIENTAAGPATVKVDDSTLQVGGGNSQTTSRTEENGSTGGATSLSLNKGNYFNNNTVTMPIMDDATSWCDEGIYIFTDVDTCIQGTSECCYATDDCPDDADTSSNRDIEGSQAFHSSSLVMGAIVVLGCSWMLVV